MIATDQKDTCTGSTATHLLGIGTGNPGVFQGYPHPYPGKAVPVPRGMGMGMGFSKTQGSSNPCTGTPPEHA